MPRPIKWRKVCCLPETELFGPLNEDNKELEEITMSVEEYETIRLIDLKGLTQEECANQMEIARGTVQSIYKEARSKLAKAIVIGHRLRIEGGDYQLHSEEKPRPGCHRCRRRQCTQTVKMNY